MNIFSRKSAGKSVLAAALLGFAGLTLVPADADAARLGGGRSVGKQSSNVTQRQAPAQPAQAAPATPTAQPGAPAPAPARNRWLGPLAGIAAGLGIAALLSHLGMGGALGEMLGSALLVGGLLIAAMLLWRMYKGSRTPALAGAGAGGPGMPGAREPIATAFTPIEQQPTSGALAAPAPAAGGGTWTVPAGFDADDFVHIAKMYFVRMQAAWDRGDEADIRNFTTPEMFAEIKLDLLKRGGAANQTDVVTLDALFLGVEEGAERTLASVRLSGMIREAPGAAAEPFSEVWNLEKPASAKASWVLAGIQQE